MSVLEKINSIILLLLTVNIFLSSCATKRTYHGVDATDLSGLYMGMSRNEAAKITGRAKREFQCDLGNIVTYVYDRGYTGCIEDGTCVQTESEHLRGELMADVLTFGLISALEPQCLKTCQKGYLELYFNSKDELIGVREIPTDRDGFCWESRNSSHRVDPFQRNFCSRVFTYRRPSTVSKSLLLHIEPEDIPEKICDIFK